ncbi:hypothetical protein BVRB_030610, partial [Beta vulgaris subsp. vulgaris]
MPSLLIRIYRILFPRPLLTSQEISLNHIFQVQRQYTVRLMECMTLVCVQTWLLDTLAPSSEAILNQLTDVDRDDSAGKERLEPSDTHSIHSRISSNRTLCRSQTSGAQENGQSELNSVSVEIKPPAAERTSASDSAGPEQSSSSNADSKIID